MSSGSGFITFNALFIALSKLSALAFIRVLGANLARSTSGSSSIVQLVVFSTLCLISGVLGSGILNNCERLNESYHSEKLLFSVFESSSFNCGESAFILVHVFSFLFCDFCSSLIVFGGVFNVVSVLG